MSLAWLEEKYIHNIQSRLEKFEQKGLDVYNFRCPFCGDSKKNSKKKRAYFKHYEEDSGWYFSCFNDACSINKMAFKTFLSRYDPNVFEQFNKEALLEKFSKYQVGRKKKKKEISQFSFSSDFYDTLTSPLSELTRVVSLPEDHVAKKYLVKRKIPLQHMWRLFYTENYNKWANLFDHSKKRNEDYPDPRIVIPLFDVNKKFFGAQGRALNELAVAKYSTALADRKIQAVFGLDMVDMSRTFYVLEGPFDSMFVPNSVAQLGSSKGDIWNGNEVFVLDNQPRHLEIMKIYNKKISSGKKIFIWPSFLEGKDINSCVVDGELLESDIPKVLEENTFQGLEAVAKFNEWRKI